MIFFLLIMTAGVFVMKYSFEELNEIFSKVDDDAAVALAAAVNSHKRIFVYGAGRSGLMLRAFAMRLAQVGRVVYVVGETVTPAICEGDLLVLASASGSTASVIRYAEVATEVGADIYAITATEGSALCGIDCRRVFIDAPSKDNAKGSIMGTLFEQSVLLFCDHVIAIIGADHAMMRAAHANLE